MFQNFEIATDKTVTPARLGAVRGTLPGAGLTGFIVPRADAHQGETVAPRDERLAWLTGFTGSAGLAIVMDRTAAIFVDGRYTLQAADQVAEGTFEIVAIHEVPVADWVRQTAREGDRIGFDPWLHGRAEIDRLRAAAEAVGAEIVPTQSNHVDLCWPDQPPPPLGAVRVHPETVAGVAVSDKRTAIAATVAQNGASAGILTLPDSIAWLLNIRGADLARSPVAHGFAVIGTDGHVDLVMDPDKLDGAVRDHLGNEVTLHPVDALPGLVDALDGPVLLDKATCPLWFADRLASRGAEILWDRDPCVLPKALKNPVELDGMREAHLRDGAAMVTFLAGLGRSLSADETVTEIDVVTRLERCRAARGDLTDISFDTISGSGPNGAIVHYRVNHATNRTIVPGDLLLVDSGGQYPDGTTDITRTVATGAVSADQKRHFTLVLKGMIAVSRARWPDGLTGRDIDVLARAALWREGLDYDHGTGHGVGACLNVHEGPASLSRRGTEPLRAGMILSNEPGYYRTGAYGIRIENLVIVEPASIPAGGDREMLGFETLTWCPIDRRLIDADLLTPDERAWLDAYHADVLRRIGPLVSAEDVRWLYDACQPIIHDPDAEPLPMPEAFRLTPAQGTVVVRAGGAIIAESTSAMVLHERTYDPVFYLPREDVGMAFLERSDKVTTCPHKGDAAHFHVIRKSTPIENAAWSYEAPIDDAAAIAGFIAFYADKVTVEEI